MRLSLIYILNQFSFFSGVFPITVPPCKGTHGDRVVGDNTRSRHNLRHFSYYATSPAWQLRNRTPRILVLFVKSDARFARRRCGSCSVFEVARNVNKHTLNNFWIRRRLPQLFIIYCQFLIFDGSFCSLFPSRLPLWLFCLTLLFVLFIMFKHLYIYMCAQNTK